MQLYPDIMIGLKQGKQELSPEIIISYDRIAAADANTHIPNKYRLATIHEITFKYMYDDAFAAYLNESRWVWTAGIGLKSKGFHQIDDDLSFSEVDFDAYRCLQREHRSFHKKGPFIVAAAVHDAGYGYQALVLDGFLAGTSYKARAAFVKESEDTVSKHLATALRR